jgi:2,4-dienoyl-CoA reductase-like NADH-dependent reductase (Old Yellow Enzyme family)
MTTPLSAPLDLGRGPQMANRLMLAPMTNWQSNPDGTLHDDEYHWLTMRAQGGFGLTMTCAAHVQKGGKAFDGQLGVCSDDHLPGLERLAKGIHAAGSVSSVQLHHGGERADMAISGEDVVAPWDDPEKGVRAQTTGEVEGTIEAFIAAAVRAEKAGFNGVEIHGAHSYLLCQYLYDDKNQRTDRFGITYENRTRIYWNIIDGIRAETGDDFQLGLRLSPERHGMKLAESRRFAQEVMTSGKIDYLDMSLWDCFKEPYEADYAGRPLIDFFTELDRGSCKLGAAGKLMTAADAKKCLDHGADFALIGRGAMIHHDFARQALADARFESVALPVSRDHFRAEGLSDKFIELTSKTWPSYVAD